MEERVLTGLTILFGASAGASLLVHWLVVCRALYRDGARLPTGLLPWRWFHEMTRYKDLLRSRSESLSRYYIIVMNVWFAVVLGLVLGLVWLWRSPPS